MEAEQIRQLEKEHVMQTYSRLNLIVDYGKGCYVYDQSKKKYLDFLGGIATCAVGHGNKEVVKAISGQAKKLINITNLYYTEPQAILAEKLSKISGLKKCFFCNSGTEANEAAIKLVKKTTGKKKFIAFEHCFHGRTSASLALTWKEEYKKPFEPLGLDVAFVEYNNIEALEKAITKETAAVIIEPIQGEAGVIIPEKGYLKKVSEICKKNSILLIADEVQSGTGRTGKFFAYQHESIMPDIVTTAKGLANGVPIGVCISNLDFEKGEHASTFGGNNLSCAAANATIDYILKNKLMENAVDVGGYFVEKLNKLKNKHKIIKKVKGKGLMVGVELNDNKAKEIVEKCLENGLIINNAADNILRFLPPLIVGKNEVDKCVGILEKVLK